MNKNSTQNIDASLDLMELNEFSLPAAEQHQDSQTAGNDAEITKELLGEFDIEHGAGVNNANENEAKENSNENVEEAEENENVAKAEENENVEEADENVENTPSFTMLIENDK